MVGILLQSLVDLEEQEKAVRNYQWEVNEKAFFDEQFKRWTNFRKRDTSPASSLACDDTPSEVPRDAPRESPRETSLHTPC